MTKRVYLDFESRSQCDIWSSGAWVYSAHPTTEVLCLCYAIDNEPIVHHNFQLSWLPVDSLRAYFNALVAEGAEFHAHNAYFERSIWKHKLEPLGFVPVPIRQWRCTAAKAAAHALPRTLEKCAEALDCKNKKDMSGSKMMKFLSSSTGPIAVENMERLIEYCRQDVAVEREIDQRLPDLCEREQRVWFLDQYINDTGVMIDREACQAAVVCVNIETERLTEQLQLLTNEEVNAGTQTAAIRKYLASKGVVLANLTKKTVTEAVSGAEESVRKILELRQQLSLTSNAKYRSFLDVCGSDGRVRDTLVYHGASTGRWTGKLVQLQNLVKPSEENFDNRGAIAILKNGGYDSMSLFYGDQLLNTLSSCIRGMLIPSPGYEMFITDFAAIEARVVMWLSNETVGIRMFEEGDQDPSIPDIYVKTAWQIFRNKTLTKKANKKERQVGKQTVLGCIAKGSMVYSDKGYIPIETINQGQRVWDGEQWVNFLELVPTGKKSVIQIGSLWLTPDHKLLTTKGWQTAEEIALSGDTKRLKLGQLLEDGRLQARSSTLKLNAVSLCAVYADLKKAEESISFGEGLRVHVANVVKAATDKRAEDPANTLISSLIHVYESAGASATTILDDAVKTKIALTSDAMVLEAFLSPSNPVERSWNTLLLLMGGGSGDSLSIELIMPKATDEEISALLRNSETIVTKVEECFDLAWAGSGMFQVGEVIAHNCGFGMGIPKFQDTCDKYSVDLGPRTLRIERQGEEIMVSPIARDAVDGYRSMFKKVVQFWYDLEDGAKRAINGHPTQVGKVVCYVEGEFLRIKLPSGRTLAYHRPKISGDRITFMSADPITKRYVPETTWGGALVENVTQAVARDLMADSMLQAASTGFRILFTVHDELVLEAPRGTKTEEDVLKIVRTVPTWAKGCPVNAECEKVDRYKK